MIVGYPGCMAVVDDMPKGSGGAPCDPNIEVLLSYAKGFLAVGFCWAAALEPP